MDKLCRRLAQKGAGSRTFWTGYAVDADHAHKRGIGLLRSKEPRLGVLRIFPQNLEPVIPYAALSCRN